MQNLLNRVQEIREKNIIIADFMDVEDVQISNLKYHESWDWLMPVVARITRNAYYIESSAENQVRQLLYLTPYAYIEDVHDAVYKFCKWWKAKKG